MANVDDLLVRAKDLYDNGDPSHDFAHILRVTETCRRLGQALNAHLDLLLPAAILHDVVNLPKNHVDRSLASRMAAEKSRQILADLDYTEAEIQKVAQIIAEHSYSLGLRPSSIESAILQDADKLDALGAIGIMRTVTVGSRMGASYYNLAESLSAPRTYDDKAFTVDHFYTKLFKLPDLMNTEVAKIEAHKRVLFMRSFLAQLGGEIMGDASH